MKPISPPFVPRYQFKESGKDSLIKIAEFDKISGSDFNIGIISGVNVCGSYILISDQQQNKVFAIDKKTFKYAFTIGDGPGNGPGNLNGPFGLQTLGDTILISHYTGPFLYSLFTLKGDFIRSVTRKSFEFHSSDPSSSFISDSTLYYTKNIATNLRKMITYSFNGSMLADTLLPVTDFHREKDSVRLSKVLTRLFIIKSSNPNLFYAIPGNKPLVNVYTYTGKLVNSYDLREVPILDIYFTQMIEYMGFKEGINYFPSVVTDRDDNIFFPAVNITNLNAITDKKVSPDSVKTDNFYISVNIKKRVYTVHKVDVALQPLKIIDKQLWCYNNKISQLAVYKLPD